jgi:M-phase phosphoprotein 6, animal type
VSASRFGDLDTSESISVDELKRKQPELELETPPSHKLPKTTAGDVDDGSTSQRNGHGSQKSNKREKYDFNNLRRKK